MSRLPVPRSPKICSWVPGLVPGGGGWEGAGRSSRALRRGSAVLGLRGTRRCRERALPGTHRWAGPAAGAYSSPENQLPLWAVWKFPHSADFARRRRTFQPPPGPAPLSPGFLPGALPAGALAPPPPLCTRLASQLFVLCTVWTDPGAEPAPYLRGLGVGEAAPRDRDPGPREARRKRAGARGRCPGRGALSPSLSVETAPTGKGGGGEGGSETGSGFFKGVGGESGTG